MFLSKSLSWFKSLVFGHAIETAQGYGAWLHGEAVSVGMVIAVELSVLLGNVDQSEVVRLCQLLQKANLPIKAPDDMSADQFLQLMALDKKVLDGRLRLIILESIGKAVVSDTAPVSSVIKAITLHTAKK